MRVRTPEAARFLGRAAATLERWRYDRPDGPPFLKLGSIVLYDLDQLAEWAAKRTLHGGADQGDRPRPRRTSGESNEPGDAGSTNGGRRR